MVVCDSPQTEVFDVQCAEGLVILAVWSLNMELQGVGFGIVFVEESLADGWNPLVGIRVEIPVNGLACP